MRMMKTLLVTVALTAAAPAWARDEHGHERHHGGHDRHHGWHGERHHAQRHHDHHDRHYVRRYEPRYYSNYYYPPEPVYAVPAPGVHIGVPNIYIPLR